MKQPVVVFLTAALILPLFLGGCARKVAYGDAQAVETVTTDFGSTDLQMIAEKMVDSLLQSAVITGASERLVLIVKGVENRTTEHLDTRLITDKIRTQLLKSGQVRFAAMGPESQAAVEQLKYQQSGLVNPASAKSLGKMVGADYMLIGNIKSIVKQAGRRQDVYYQFTLNLMDIETGLLDWADEREIRKTASRPVVGW